VVISLNNKVALITGTSSGFGLHTAIELAKSGCFVIATMRDTNKAEELVQEMKIYSLENRIAIEQLDVTVENSINNFHKILTEKYERVDILINNAGYAFGGFVELNSLQDYQRQFDTNLFGAISITRMVLPIMREQGFGKIINISSISGQIGFPGLSAYAASKYALEGFTESLKFEVKQFGIDVVLVEPGSFRTNIWSKAKGDFALNEPQKRNPYKDMQLAIEKHVDNENAFGNPKMIAKMICKITNKTKPKFRYAVGRGVKGTIILKRLLPWCIWEKAVFKVLSKSKDN
jgi:NAD(P)-dependent dehydrogenase (short-subunit alcohol dehydrogenase family)